ncbi:MAG: transcriptional regulator [Hahellaceae bacterium]|jgi:transcriptional antiterminator Rof (Rho-off)|nr:transcriptional regulator [Hahellaceae bacterium]
MEKIIACDIHDYFEIACMRSLAVGLLLHSGDSVEGRAKDLITKDRKEFLVLALGNPPSHQTKVIPLLEIKELVFIDEAKVIPVS